MQKVHNLVSQQPKFIFFPLHAAKLAEEISRIFERTLQGIMKLQNPVNLVSLDSDYSLCATKLSAFKVMSIGAARESLCYAVVFRMFLASIQVELQDN